MVISPEEAAAILNKWRDESAQILVVAESPFRRVPRGIEGRGVRWAMGQRVKVSQVLVSGDPRGSGPTIVEFEGLAGNLSLSIRDCPIYYDDTRAASPEIREEAAAATISALSIFFPPDDGFLFYELRQP
jgi:hypothetical protein